MLYTFGKNRHQYAQENNKPKTCHISAVHEEPCIWHIKNYHKCMVFYEELSFKWNLIKLM